MTRDDRGSASVVAVCMVAALLAVTVGFGWLAAAVVARHRAQAAADLAALAAAVELPAGLETACARARTLATALRVSDVDCRVAGLDVIVTIEVSGAFGPWRVARAAARAGPAR